MDHDLFTDPIGLSTWSQSAHLEASWQGDAEVLQIAEVRLLHELAAYPVVVTDGAEASRANLHGVGPDAQYHSVARAKRTVLICTKVDLAAADDSGRYEVPR
jgi:hypothetical protein